MCKHTRLALKPVQSLNATALSDERRIVVDELKLVAGDWADAQAPTKDNVELIKQLNIWLDNELWQAIRTYLHRRGDVRELTEWLQDCDQILETSAQLIAMFGEPNLFGHQALR